MSIVPSRLTIFYNPNGSLMGATLDTKTVDDTGTFPPVQNQGFDLTIDKAGLFNLPDVLGEALAAALDTNTALKAVNAAQAAQIQALSDQVAALSHFGN